MLRLPGSSLRSRLLILVILTAVPLFALTLHSASKERRLEINHQKAYTEKLAHFIAADQERLIEGVRQFLFMLSQAPEIRRNSPDESRALFSRLLGRFAIYKNLTLVDPHGNPSISTVAYAEGENFAGRAWFERAKESKSFVPGDYTASPESRETVVVLAYPVLDENGRVQGILCAQLSLNKWIDQITPIVQLPAYIMITVLNQEGTVLARYPDPEKWVGECLPESPIVKYILLHGEGSADGHSVGEDSCIFGFAPLPNAPESMYVAVGVERDTALMRVNRNLVWNLALLGLATGASIIIAFLSVDLLLLRRVKTLTKTIENLAEGELRARTGIRYGRSEFSRLARTVDEMAERMERRQIEAEQLEEVLRDSGRRFRAIFNHAFQFTSIIDPDGTVLEMNQTALDFAEIKISEVFGQPFWKTPCWSVSPEAQRRLKEDIAEAAKGKVIRHEAQNFGAGGKTAFIDFSIKPLKDASGQITMLIAEGRDITERKKAEESLRESQEELRLLSSRLLTAQEDERKRIARELHDSIGQSLSAIKFAVENTINRNQHEAPSPCTSSLEPVVQIVQYAIDEVRKIMTDLRPSILDDLGVLATLGWFCREFQKIYSAVHIEKEIDIQEDQIPAPLKIVIFRIVQESLNNIAKHSGASFVNLSLKRKMDSIELVIEDDGEGFDTENTKPGSDCKSGFGLSSMRERAKLSEGSLEIESVRGEGTIIRVTWLSNDE